MLEGRRRRVRAGGSRGQPAPSEQIPPREALRHPAQDGVQSSVQEIGAEPGAGRQGLPGDPERILQRVAADHVSRYNHCVNFASMTMGSIIGGLLFSSIGLVVFGRGKREMNMTLMGLGGALM